MDGHKLAETSFKKNVNPKSKSSGFGLQYKVYSYGALLTQRSWGRSEGTACGKFDLAARRKKKKNATVVYSLSANSAFVAGYAQPWAAGLPCTAVLDFLSDVGELSSTMEVLTQVLTS